MPDQQNNGLSESHRQQLEQIAERHSLSIDAVRALFVALQAGGGTMAQFNHPDLGGMGQWSGGMTMIGDFSNAALKERVQSACTDLAAILSTDGGRSDRALANSADALKTVTERAGLNTDWWPANLGEASTAGAQNDSQYAYFASAHRLAIKQDGKLTLYDTADHEIFGVSQQQGQSTSLTFQSQHGLIKITDLKKIE